jgi:hypothetical protein
MIISRVPLKDLITNHLKQATVLIEVLEIKVNSLMKNEWEMYLEDASANKTK